MSECIVLRLSIRANPKMEELNLSFFFYYSYITIDTRITHCSTIKRRKIKFSRRLDHSEKDEKSYILHLVYLIVKIHFMKNIVKVLNIMFEFY